MKFELEVTIKSDTIYGLGSLMNKVYSDINRDFNSKDVSFYGHPETEDGKCSFLLKRHVEEKLSDSTEESKSEEEAMTKETIDDFWYPVDAVEQMKDGKLVVGVPDDQFKYGIGYMTHEGGVKRCVVVGYNKDDDTFNPIDIYPEEAWIREFRGAKFTEYRPKYLTSKEAYEALSEGKAIDDVEFNKVYFAQKVDDPIHGTEENVVFTFDSCGDLEMACPLDDFIVFAVEESKFLIHEENN